MAPAPVAPDPLQRRARALRARHRGDGFTVRAEEPFVVLGNEPRAVVARRSISTIRWATDRLRAQYFERDPERIIDIWLLGDAASYRHWAQKLTGRVPDTPYGFYSPVDRALIMNIATGGGTLVHELVHPFVEANFPTCPAWFNEGLASLYEQCGDAEGRIWGYTNWRLAGLQEAIVDGRLPSFRALTATDDQGFYEDDPGTHYAQARYLCFYLQEIGVLEDFYRRFSRGVDDDRTGYASLRAVLGTKDMRGFQRRWERYVLGLRFG